MADADPQRTLKPAAPAAAEIDLPPEAMPDKPKRRWLRLALLLGVPLLIALVGGYFYLTSGRYVSTDNAYVRQGMASVSPDVSGRIVAVEVRENQRVKAGDILFRIDPEPFRIALTRRSALAEARVDVATEGDRYRHRRRRHPERHGGSDAGAGDLPAAGGADAARLHHSRLVRCRDAGGSGGEGTRRHRAGERRARAPAARLGRRRCEPGRDPGCARPPRTGRAQPRPHRRARAQRRHRQPDEPAPGRQHHPLGVPCAASSPARRGSRRTSRKPTSTTCASASP
ncbi:biotin/lipoyl-binding protein [Sphingomonas sp. MMS24-JH45]